MEQRVNQRFPLLLGEPVEFEAALLADRFQFRPASVDRAFESIGPDISCLIAFFFLAGEI